MVGFWNAAIGFVVMRFARDPIAAVIPQAARRLTAHEIAVSTAIVVCVRNEQPDRVARNLDVMMDDLVNAGCARHFHVYVLSDTNRPEIAAHEAATFTALQRAWDGRLGLSYRHREANTGFKAGNIRDFLE